MRLSVKTTWNRNTCELTVESDQNKLVEDIAVSKGMGNGYKIPNDIINNLIETTLQLIEFNNPSMTVPELFKKMIDEYLLMSDKDELISLLAPNEDEDE